MIKINKKGFVEKFLTLLFVGIYIIIIFVILYSILTNSMREKQKITESDLNVMDGLYSSRILLNQPNDNGEKLYAKVIEGVNSNDFEINGKLASELQKAVENYYPDKKIINTWLIIVNDETYSIGPNGVYKFKPKNINYKIQDAMPKITIPNPQGKNIMFLAKPYSAFDEETGRIYGYRAGLLKGSTQTFSELSAPDGMPLEKIKNIPNIECNEEESSVGRICNARPELVAQLREISANELVPRGQKAVITQAFRTYEIQKKLYLQACDNGCDCSKDDCSLARNPDKIVSPSGHLDGTAIDIIIYSKDGKKLNGEGGVDPTLVENIMCTYGFVRFSKESWHFEYGSRQWRVAQEKRDAGTSVCRY